MFLRYGSKIIISSSIENWKEKIKTKYDLPEYIWWKDWRKSVLFVGLYNPIDYLKFILHRGEKTIIWCGSDILQLGWFAKIIRKFEAEHICESSIERSVLNVLLRQNILQQPLFFGNKNDYKISFKSSKNPQVFIHINKNAEAESGLWTIEQIAPRVPDITFHIYGKVDEGKWIKNIIYHGFVSEEQFNDEIKNYQASLRMHEFNGFADTTAKSILMGQYPITRIKFPYIDSYQTEEELIKLLKELKNKKEPNYKVREYYFNTL